VNVNVMVGVLVGLSVKVAVKVSVAVRVLLLVKRGVTVLVGEGVMDKVTVCVLV
jgi:hypothetical protein